MKIAIMGTGGVGGYFGARLAAAGADVTFIARGEHLVAMERDGLKVESPLGNLHIHPVHATDDPNSIGSAELVMIGVKLWSTEEAMAAVKPLIGPEAVVVSFQNGVDAVDILTNAYGAAHVMGGAAHIAAGIERPGVIRHTGTLQRLTFGELDGRTSARGKAFLEVCLKAGIDAHLSDNIQGVIWKKFVFLVALSGMTSLTRLPIGPIRDDPDTRAMLRSAMDEAARVGRAKGVDLAPDCVEQQLRFADSLPYDMTSSMLRDLQSGNRLEVAWLAGAVARLGSESGIETPVNRCIYTALKLHAAGAKAS